MKKLLFLICFISIGAIAQSDSLTIKLKQLKVLRDSSLITQNEYDQLRLKELNLVSKTEKPIQNNESLRLRKKIQGKITGACIGSIFCGAGVYGVIYNKNKPIIIKYDTNGKIDQKDYDNQVRINKNNVSACSIFTGIIGVFSIANLVTLQSTINKYHKAKQSVSLNFNPAGFSIAYNF